MHHNKKTLIAAALAAQTLLGLPGVGHAQETAVVRTLVEQGEYWKSRGDNKKAADALQKALRLDPNNVDALSAMVAVESALGRTASSQNYLNKLKSIPAGKNKADALEKDMARGMLQEGSALDTARSLARGKQFDEALRFYREHFGRQRPSGLLALEYYQTLGATKGGWDQARRELESLAKENPNDERFALAYAQHLTYQESSRRQGIVILQSLAGSSSVGPAAQQSWRQALVWLNAKRTDLPLYKNYTDKFSADAEIQNKVASLVNTGEAAGSAREVSGPSPAEERQAEAGRKLAFGYDALDKGDLANAERAFADLLRADPNNRDANGGLGVIRLRQGRFRDAENLLGKAARSDRSGKWNSALSAARRGSLEAQASAAINKKDYTTARKLYTQMKDSLGGDPAGDIGLARLSYELGEYSNAEKLYRAVIQKNPQSNDARLGLILSLSAQGNDGEAQRLIDQMPAGSLASAGGADVMRAAIAYESARRELRGGNSAGAERMLEDAIAYNPRYPWSRIDLGRLYWKQGRNDEARAIVQPLVADLDAPEESLYAAAIFYSEINDHAAAAATMARIPPEELNQDQRTLSRKTEFRSVLQQSANLYRLGRKDDARRLLNSLEGDAQLGTDVLLELATEYANQGDLSGATRLGQQYRSSKSLTDLNIGDALQYGYLLMKTNQNAELQALIRRLQTTSLSADQSKSLGELRRAIALQQSDSARTRGDLAGAFDALSPSLAERPNDPELLSALARLYADDRRYDEALRLYQSALQVNPRSTATLSAAMGAAAAAGDFRSGKMYAQALEQLAPNDPVNLTAIGRLYRSAGDTDRAAQYFKAALAEEVRQTGTTLGVNPDASLNNGLIRRQGMAADQLQRGQMPSNPFRADGGKQPQANPFGGSNNDYFSNTTPAPRNAFQADALPSPPDIRNAPAPVRPAPAFAPPVRRRDPNDRVGLIQDELRSLVKPATHLVAGGPTVRSREGEAGLSELTEISAPMEYQRSMFGGVASVHIKPMVLNSGTAAQDIPTLNRFGGGPISTLNTLGGGNARVPDQQFSGVALGAGFATDMIRFEVASRPTNIDKTDIAGSAYLNLPLGPYYTVGLRGSRKPVTDSFLSYVGATDPRSGVRWGAVSATGGRVDLTREEDGIGVYGYLGAYRYTGENVADNTKREFGVGTYYKMIDTPDERLTFGLGINSFSFAENLGFYTLGHGGYFSPQRYISTTIPVEYWARKARMSYSLNGAFGFQSIKQEGNVYFPTSALLQAQGQTALDTLVLLGLANAPLGANYEGRSRNGFAYNIAGSVEYALTNRLMLGGVIGLDNASDFQQFKLGLYLRFYMDQENPGVNAPPKAPNPFMD